MDLILSQLESGKYIFSVKTEEDVFASNFSFFPFIGDYGEYENKDQVVNAVSKFSFLNPEFIEKFSSVSLEQKNSIKSRLISVFNRQVHSFIKMIDQIEGFDDKSKLGDRVNLLKQQFDQFTKSVTQAVMEFEGDTGENKDIEGQDVQQIGFEEVQDPFAKDLIKLKKRIKFFNRKFKKKFGEYLKSGSKNFLVKLASLDKNVKNDIIIEHAEEVLRNLKFGNSKIESVENDNGETRVVISSDEGSFVIHFTEDLLLSAVHPMDKLISSHPYMSNKFFNDIWFPVFKSVGNYRLDENVVIVPYQPDDVKIGLTDGFYLKNRFIGFDIRDNSTSYVNIYLSKSNSPMFKTCMFSFSDRKDREENISNDLESKKNEILNSNMVLCSGSGTKYDGIAGVMSKDKIQQRAGYFDVPVTFKFDNGFEETVVLPSYFLERYA